MDSEKFWQDKSKLTEELRGDGYLHLIPSATHLPLHIAYAQCWCGPRLIENSGFDAFYVHADPSEHSREPLLPESTGLPR